MSEAKLYGVMAEFASSAAVIAAARGLYLNGYRHMDAFTPYPVEGLDEAMHPRRFSWIPIAVFCGGLFGAIYGYFLQYWAAAISYPLNVGGRPLNSWPAFTVSAFEASVLCAIAAGFFAFLWLCRLPLLYHPAFNAPDFDRASQDRFFLCVEGQDTYFDRQRLRHIFERHGALRVSEVPS